MTIEKQCCSLEQAKRLKELGVEQISYFIWGEKSKALMESWTVDGIEDTFYSAYTDAELGVILPDDTRTYRYDDRWSAYAPIEGILQLFAFAEDKTEAQCRAALLIHLIENNIVSVKEINQRLQNA